MSRDTGFIAQSPSVHQSRSARLLYLVEDDPVQAETIKTQIQYYGYVVRILTDLGQVASAISAQEPAALIMDVVFPQGDTAGPQAIIDLRHALDLQMPVIFISASDSFQARVQAVRAGGDAYFTKPLDVPGVVDVLDKLLVREVAAPMRVLVVDDSALQANVNAMHLRRAGMETAIVSDVAEVLGELTEFLPELILLDMYMPDCNGMELASLIRQIEAFVSVPIVFLSSETDREVQLEAVGLGGDDFLVKPIRPDHLVVSVKARIERYRKLRALMLHDSLTGLLNHTTTKERLAQEIERAKRESSQLCFAMLDLDDFKKVNDRFGHPTGDRVIRSLSQLLTGRLRSADSVGRYGGEEFAVILPNTPLDGGVYLMNDLCDSFGRLQHRHGAEQFSCTFSCGVSTFPAVSTSGALIDAADHALYRAKHAGKNRVCAVD